MPSLNPRLAAVLTPSDDDTVKLMLGRSFRVPSIYELTNQANGFSFADNDVIGPETIYTGEFEYRRQLPLDVSLLATGYVNRISDLLNYVATAEEVEGFTNVADPMWTLGLEGEVRHQTREGRVIAAQYSFQRTRLNDPFGDETVQNSPEHLGAAWIVLPLAPAGALTWATRVAVDLGRLDRNNDGTAPYALVDTTLSGRAAHVRWAAGLKNALDAAYAHPVSDRLLPTRLTQDGRTLRLDVALDF